MLLAVLLFGIDVNGARRWFSLGSFGTLQPSEFAKMLMLIIFAKFISDNKDRISRFSTIMITGILYLIPLVLILPLFFGLDGILCAGPAADSIAFIVTVILIGKELKKMKRMEQQSAPALS